MTVYIVSRHQGAIQWILSKGFIGKILTHIDLDQVNTGDIVIGVLPIVLVKALIDKGATVYSLQLPLVPKELRGQELSVETMNRYGAKLFKITSLEWEEI